MIFPPLAHNASVASANMPSGITHTTAVLTDEQAFDVAAFVNSQPRPIKSNLQADFPARKNKPVDAAFAPYTPGFSAEQHKYGPWQPILEAREKGGGSAQVTAEPAVPAMCELLTDITYSRQGSHCRRRPVAIAAPHDSAVHRPPLPAAHQPPAATTSSGSR